ncbi:MAG: hypothetical protein ACREF4_00275 [Gammaproteobacteria bacterium]
MPRWMMKFAVEAHLGLKEDIPELLFRHPGGGTKKCKKLDETARRFRSRKFLVTLDPAGSRVATA